MRVHRLCRSPFVALDGEGARLYGARWNSPGVAIVYTSSSRALAALEQLVHVSVTAVPRDLVLLTIDVPDDATAPRVIPAELPAEWAMAPESAACRARGDAWARTGDALALFVPAAPVPEECNVLLNPRAPGFGAVRVVDRRPFTFDPRLLH